MTDLIPAAAAAPAPRPDDATAPGGATVLDAQALANLAQLDPTGAHRLVPRVMSTYRSSLARLMGQLAQARPLSDVATLRLVAHTLKSSSASVGALSLSALCGTAEQLVREGRLQELPPILDLMEAEAQRVDVAVHQLLYDK